MFNNGKDQKKKTPSNPRPKASGPAPARGGINTIDEHTVIRGDLEAGGDIRIDGKLIGDVVCQAKLIIGPQGSIEGDADCQQAVVEGKFKGNMLIRDMLALHESARVTGSIRARKMAVSAGCVIDGQCTVTGDADPAAVKVPATAKAQAPKNEAVTTSNGAAVKA